jgi:hypothetical protein
LGKHQGGVSFFANDRVSEADILSGHFQSARERMAATDGPVLVLHDTTEFTYQRDRPELIGITKRITNSKRDLAGNPRLYTACGILMHSSLAITTAGLPLGLSAVKFWTRDKFKGTAALKRKINPTRVPIEKKESVRWLENLKQSTELLDDPGRCIHIGDQATLDQVVEERAPGFGTFSAHALDRKQHLLAVRTHADHDKQRD